jgi:hypothetical protein
MFTLVIKQILLLAVLYSDEEVQLEVMSSKFLPMGHLIESPDHILIVIPSSALFVTTHSL